MSEETIFATAAAKKSARERQAYLNEACAGNPELRAQVEELLRANDDAGSFLHHAPAGLGIAAEATVDGPAASSSVSLPLLEPCDKPDRIGKLVGKVGEYEIIEVVGSGGMGTVLRAFDTKLSRVVAVKVIAPELAANAEAVKRFLREAQAAAAVVHDHVVTIHAVDESHQPPFLVMQFIDGQTLQQKIEREGALELKHILRIGSQAAAGLEAAHKTGLIHRDVKPSNILLENGVERVKITDFGLARAADDLEATKTGLIAGTPLYMSPEQAKGEPIDARSDLFSLGSVLYTMCTGRPAFRAETTMGVLRRVCDDAPRPIHEVNAEIPSWLEAIVSKLLAKSPTDRFQSAGEVAELLSQHLAHVQQPAIIPQPVGWDKLAERAPAHQRGVGVSPAKNSRRRWSIAAAAVLLLCAGLALAESAGVTHVAATVIRIVRGDGTLVVEIDDPNIQVLLDGEELVITGAGPKVLRLRPGQHELQTVKGGKSAGTQQITITRDGRQVVKVAREEPAPAVERKESASAGPAIRQVWADAVDFSFSGAPSPEGKYLSYADWASGDVGVHEVATGKNRRLTNQGWPEYGGSPIFSPDTKQVAYSWWNKDKVYELRLVGLEGSEPRVLYPNKEKEVRYLETSDWSADGNQILAFFSKKGTGQSGDIVLISVVDGSVRVLKTLDWGSPGKMRFSPDGRYVAYSVPPEKTSRKRDIFLLATDGSGESSLVEHPADDFVLGWAPDGKRVLFASDRTASMGAWLIALAEGKPLGAPVLVRAEMGAFEAMGLTRSGSFYYGLFSGGQNVYTATVDLKTDKVLSPPAVAIQRGEGSNWAPAWSPDGKYLACVSWRPGRAPLFYIRTVESQAVRELTPNLGGFNVHSLHWSADGQAFLGAGNNEGDWGALRIAVETGAVTTLVQGEGNGVFAPIPAPDGKAFFYHRNTPSRRLMRRDLESGVEQELYQTADQAKWWTLSPDGQQLAFSAGGALKLLPAAGGEPRELTKMEGNISAIAWTPDGRHLLFQRASQLWRIPAGGGEPQATGLTMKGGLGHLRVHPDGRQVAFAAHTQPDKTEVWVLENFLPPLTDAKPPAAADASAAKSKSAAAAESALRATAGSTSSASTAAGPNPKSVPNPAVVQALRDLVAAKERSLNAAQGRFDAKVGTRMEVLAAEIDHTEARVRLAEAEQQKAAGLALLKDLVDQRQEERRLIAQMVEKGVATPDELNQADARLAEASARLAQVNANP